MPAVEVIGPRRTCVGCRRVLTPVALVRISRSSEETLQVGVSGMGRGAWLCRENVECLESAIRRGSLARALRTSLTQSDAEVLRGRLLGPVENANAEHASLEDSQEPADE